MNTYKILKKIDKKEWNNNLLKCKYSTFFQSSEFLTIEDENKYPIFIYVYNEKGETKGQLGITIIKSKKGYSSRSMDKIIQFASKLGNRGTWVSGPIIHSIDNNERREILKIFLQALDNVIKENKLMILDGYSPPQDELIDDSYRNLLKDNGYDIENFVTFVTALNYNLDDIWKNVKKNARNDVTRAQRNNIVIKEVKNKNDLEKFHQLSQTWAKTKGIEISQQKSNLIKDWNDLQSKTQSFFLAYQNDEAVAGLRIGCFNGIAYTHEVLNSYSTYGNVSGPLLTWHAIEWAKNQGMRIYDFSGGEAGPKNESDKKRYSEQWEKLLSYKRKWGGKEFPYYHFIKIKNKNNYKLFRLISKPDWLLRNYKNKRYSRPQKVKTEK